MIRSKPLHQLLLVVLTVVLLSGAVAKKKHSLSSGLKKDKDGLMALKNSVSDSGRSKINAWKARGNPCFPKPWPHITCGGGRVVAIDLANLDIVGTLPTKLKKLNRLANLDLENNEFSGTIPAKWADRRRFRNLAIINLGNNNLNGDLPNRKWNLKNAFRKLHTLILSNNLFSGGLPDGWLSTGNTFRKLKFLDLSDNQLGSDASGSALDPYTPGAEPATTGWCLLGRTDDSGWCPEVVSKARAFSLEVLDLSENGLTGQLPSQWPQLFPNLQSLLLQRNDLWSGSAAAPGALPDSWTRNTVPRAFPQLEVVVLYPGNDNICSVPDASGGFSDINAAASYVVEDDADMAYDGENPAFCPGPTQDNPPTDAQVKEGETNIEISWTAPADELANSVYGYRVALLRQNPDTEEWELVPPYTGQLLPVFGADLSTGPLSASGSAYTLDTGIAVPASGSALAAKYQAQVATVNLNLEESTARSSPEQELPVPPLEPPESLMMSIHSSTKLQLQWSLPSEDAGVGGYVVVLEKEENGNWSELLSEEILIEDAGLVKDQGKYKYNTDIQTAYTGSYRLRVTAFRGSEIPPPEGARSTTTERCITTSNSAPQTPAQCLT